MLTSLRQRFNTNRLSVGSMWKWFQWGFTQPSSHRSSESIRVPSASEVFAGGVGGLDKRRGSRLRWLGFWEVTYHLNCSATAYCASSNEIQHHSHQLSPLPCQRTCCHRRLQKCPFQKGTGLTVLFRGEGGVKSKKSNQNTPTPRLLALALFTYCCT